MSAQEIIALLESQPPGTLLIVYNMLAGYPSVTQVISRQKTHWCVCCDREIEGVIFYSSAVVENLKRMEHPWEAALVSWSGAIPLDLSELRD
jgi:hypothetical protein